MPPDRGLREMSSEVSTAAQTEGADRQLSGDKVQRIVDAMRTCVATRGITGATFEHVSREAGVSRGLLHYYFGTKERLLIEVLRGDAETRIGMMDEPLDAAKTVDEVLAVLVSGAEAILETDPGFYVILYELFSAGRQNPELEAELARLYDGSRTHLAAILDRKQGEGVLSLRFDAETCVTYLFAAADGAALQRLSDPDRDYSRLVETGTAVARFLLDAD
jgi:AcrR family transcriptional regulator